MALLLLLLVPLPSALHTPQPHLLLLQALAHRKGIVLALQHLARTDTALLRVLDGARRLVVAGQMGVGGTALLLNDGQLLVDGGELLGVLVTMGLDGRIDFVQQLLGFDSVERCSR